MTIPKIQITDEGIFAPSSQDVIDGLWDLFKNAFGSELNTSMATPQGQLVTSLAAMVTDERNQWISLMNQIDPRYSQGIWQDAIGHIYFLSRKTASNSTAQLTAIGLAGVVIAAGAQFEDSNGHVWKSKKQNIIGKDGAVVIEVECETVGLIEAAPNSITTIIKATPGLDRVFNEYAAQAGINEENRTDFELRRIESVAANSKNTNSATYGAVSNIDNVIDVYVVDNPTDETMLVGHTNYPVVRNSILVSVVGGNTSAIAKAILAKAGSGCSFNGNTLVKVTDTENFSSHQPVYNVKFLRPTSIPLYFHIRLEDKGMMSYQDEINIKNAIINGMAHGESRARIGKSIIASKFICPVASVSSKLGILSIKVGRSASEKLDFVNFGVDEYPSVNQYQITIE